MAENKGYYSPRLMLNNMSQKNAKAHKLSNTYRSE